MITNITTKVIPNFCIFLFRLFNLSLWIIINNPILELRFAFKLKPGDFLLLILNFKLISIIVATFCDSISILVSIATKSLNSMPVLTFVLSTLKTFALIMLYITLHTTQRTIFFTSYKLLPQQLHFIPNQIIWIFNCDIIIEQSVQLINCLLKKC